MIDVSILIPVKNGAKFLKQAIESAIAQRPREILVCDDGSQDSSKEIARSFGIPVLQAESPGVQAARNHLLANASQPWVQFLDADDYLLPKKISSQLNLLEQEQVGYCDLRVHFGDPDITPSAYVVDISSARNLMQAFALFERVPQTNTLLIPKRLCPPWRSNKYRYQDYWLVFDMLAAGVELVHTPFIGAGHRCGWHQNQISAPRPNKKHARLDLQSQFYKWAETAHPELVPKLWEWQIINQRRLAALEVVGC